MNTHTKVKNIDPILLAQYCLINEEQEIEKRQKDFISRISKFEEVRSLKEAKELAKKILPTANEYNVFYVGKFRCTVCNKIDTFRICIDSPEEYFSYDFT